MFSRCSRLQPSSFLPGMGRKRGAGAGAAQASSQAPAGRPGPLALDKSGSRVLITISAKPGARVTAVTDFSEDSVGVAIAAPPVEGQANTHLVKYFSQLLGVKKSKVSLEAGSRARHKVLSVEGLEMEEVEHRIREQL